MPNLFLCIMTNVFNNSLNIPSIYWKFTGFNIHVTLEIPGRI